MQTPNSELSPSELFALRPVAEQKEFLDALTTEEADELQYQWEGWWARPKQVLPPGHQLYIILSGRGWGKTRTSAEWLIQLALSGTHDWIALVGTDYESIRKVNIEGPSGFMRCCPPWIKYKYVKSPKPEIVFLNGPAKGVKITGYSAEDPEGLRGFSGTAAACDELCAWKYMRETWEMLDFGLREGDNPCVCVTTTPKPQKLLRELVKDPDAHIVRGHTKENTHINAGRVQQMMSKYADSRLGRQELEGEILDDDSGLFKGSTIDEHRIVLDAKEDIVAQRRAIIDSLDEVVIGIDPSVKKNADSDACGIVVAGRKAHGAETHYYVIEDRTAKLSPKEWAQRAVDLYRKYPQASWIVVETNQGGDMVSDSIRKVWDGAPIKEIHAVHAKQVRAESVSVLMDSGRVHHMGVLTKLEEEMTGWEPNKGLPSPNRLDAYVYALLQLSGGGMGWCFDEAAWEFLKSR